jgi:hypothetical protein
VTVGHGNVESHNFGQTKNQMDKKEQ